MSRAATTLILITRSQILRADFTRGAKPALVDHWSQARPDVADLPTLVEVALALGPRPGKQVWVLSSDLWTQTISPASSRGLGAGMPDDQLAAALNFEAESLSGLSAFEAQAGFRTLPGGAGHWIVQARTADLEQVAELLRRTGSRLAGVAHPGGVPACLTSPGSPNQAWQRVELWPDAVVCLHGDGPGRVNVHVLNSDPAIGRWRTDWQSWRQTMGPAQCSELLAAPGVAGADEADAKTVRLDDETAMTAWLTPWATALQSAKPPAPVIRPARLPMSAGRRWAMAIALAAAAVALCVAHHIQHLQSMQHYESKLRQARDPKKTFDESIKEAELKKTKLAELRTQQLQTELTLKSLSLQRQRLAHFLDQLSAQRSEDLLIEKIDLEAGEPCLHGLSLRPELADQLAAKLGETLLVDGWEVLSAKKHAKNLVADGGPWAFEIRFRTIGSATTISPGAGKTAPKRDRS